MGGKMYIVVVNFHEGLKCLNPYSLALKASFTDKASVFNVDCVSPGNM